MLFRSKTTWLMKALRFVLLSFSNHRSFVFQPFVGRFCCRSVVLEVNARPRPPSIDHVRCFLSILRDQTPFASAIYACKNASAILQPNRGRKKALETNKNLVFLHSNLSLKSLWLVQYDFVVSAIFLWLVQYRFVVSAI